jgi:hypothetical protein
MLLMLVLLAIWPLVLLAQSLPLAVPLKQLPQLRQLLFQLIQLLLLTQLRRISRPEMCIVHGNKNTAMQKLSQRKRTGD